MARTLEELVLRLNADSRQLRRELGIVERKGKQTATALQTSFGKANRGFAVLSRGAGLATAGLAALGGTAGLGAAVKSSLDFADAIDKTASKLGVSTDALQEWRFAAEQSGVAQNTLEMAVQRFTRRSAEAAIGTGEARDAIAQLGISLRDSNGQIRSTEELFGDAVKALGEIDAPAEKLRLAFKLFDSEGAVLVNLADNFANLTEQAREMGVVIDSEVIRSAAEMKGQVDALATATKADLTAALVSLGPILVSTAKGVAALATNLSYLVDSFRELGDRSSDNLRARLEEIGTTLAKQQRAFNEQTRNLFGSSGLQEGQRLPGELQAIGARIRELQEERRRITEILNQRDEQRARRQPPATAPPGSGVESKADESARKAAEKEAEKRREAIALAGIEAEQQKRLLTAKLEGEEAYRRVTEQIELENEARRAGIDLSTEEGKRFEEAVRARQKAARDLAKINEESKNFLGDISDDIESFGNRLSDSFAEMVVSGRSSFKQLGQAFLTEFVSRAVQGLVLSPLFTALGAQGGVLGTLFGGNRAGGGDLLPGRVYQVGERGPERIVTSTRGTVIPNSALSTPRAASAGGSYAAPVSIQVINQHSGAEVSAREETGPGGMRQIHLMIADVTDRNIQAGRHDRSLRSRFQQRARGGVA